eukprot:4641690-Amphidinium_carterae.1
MNHLRGHINQHLTFKVTNTTSAMRRTAGSAINYYFNNIYIREGEDNILGGIDEQQPPRKPHNPRWHNSKL